MCGFVSIHASNNQSLDQYLVPSQTMLNTIIHRGPDGTGMKHVPNQAIFRHCRLSIIDLLSGKQPMSSDDGRFTLIFNGEIYNHIELKNYLKSKNVYIRTNSDTEVLLKILIEEGISAIDKLNGMFSFIFHDNRHNSWIAARDPLGIKPLYYHSTRNNLIFASEIKAILKFPDIEIQKNSDAFNEYLTFQFCLDEKTLFKDIFKLKPGHYILGEGKNLKKIIKYYETTYEVDNQLNEKDCIERLRVLVDDSVSKQMRTDTKLGTYLSGGIDSSLISSLASEKSKSKLMAFHGKFNEEGFDESYYAKQVSVLKKIDYREFIPSTFDFISSMEKLIYGLDEPIAGPGLFPQYIVAKGASKDVKVILGGQGGDEIFGGYTRYYLAMFEQALKNKIFNDNFISDNDLTLENLMSQISSLKNYKPLITKFFKENLFGNIDERYINLIDRSENLEMFLSEDFLKTYDKSKVFSLAKSIFDETKSKSFFNKMCSFDTKTLLPSLLHIEDRVSMLNSLESRVPLLDKRIVDFVATIPTNLKFRNGELKYLLKKSFSNELPNSILNRKDKMGFPVPLDKWIKSDKKVKDFLHDTLTSNKSLQRNIFKKKYLKNIVEHSGTSGRMLWGALSLELWHNSYFN